MRRPRPDLRRLDAVAIHQAWHLYAAAVRQAVYQAVIGNVSVDDARVAGLHRVDDGRGVLVTLAELDLTVALVPLAQTLPLRDLRLAAAWVLVEGDAEVVNQIGAIALDEPG